MFKQFLKKSSALLLALCVLMLAVPMSSFVLADGFTSVNVLRNNVSASRCVQFYPSNHYVDDSTRIPEETMAYLTDGDTSTTKDCYGALDWDPPRYIGVEYTLDDSYYIGDLKIYSGYSELIDTFEVYASDSLDDLYNDESSLVASSVDCNGTAKTLTLNKTVKYVAFLISNYTYNARIAEFEAWTAEEAGGPDPGEPGFDSVNVLRNNVSASRCVQFYPSTYYVGDATHISDEAIGKTVDGDTVTTTDCQTALDWDPPRYLGVEFTLDDTYYIGELKIYSGYTTSVDTFDVYASDSFETLYSEESLVAAGVKCDNTGAQTLEVNGNVKYVTFLISGIELYCARIAEFEAWTAEEAGGPDPGEPGFDSVNVLRNNVSASRCVQFYPTNNYVGDSERIPAETISFFTDGDTATRKDSMGALDWDPPRYIGVEYTLDDSYYIGELKIYSGYTAYIDTFEVYASNSLDDLYDDESSLVASGVNCDDTGAKTLALNKKVKYVVFLISGYTYNARIAEFEAWTAEEAGGPDPGEPGFTPENVMKDATAKSVAQYTGDGHVGEEAIITEEQIAKFTDGDTATHIDLSTSLDWDPARRAGVEYAFEKAEHIGTIKLYAAIGEEYPETYRVYASDSLETLYTDDCLLVSGAKTTGNVISVDVNKQVQYIAFFCDSYTGNPRFKEIEAYTACSHADTEARGAVEATCTEAGATGDIYCLICGKKIADNKVIDALGHKYHWVVTKPATAEENGLAEEICSVCGNKSGESRVIDHISGDINNDGSVNNKDITRLLQYLSGWEVEVNEKALDVNGDGKVDNKDLVRLFRYLSGISVDIF
ncbi:MAG: dockerin type I repeat-containing protein [Clostridia bacterium]|nr:dockerin type I repeat-containing protein [Clostridia bacterium]